MEVIFGIFPIIFLLTFALVFGIIIFVFIRGASVWSRNNRSPRLTVDATAVAKRSSVSSHMHTTDSAMAHTTHSTSYYVTFQVDSGDRMEFLLTGRDFGLIIEGDKGKLTFQGSRFISFERV